MPTQIFMTMGILSAGLGFFLLQKNVEEAKDESSEKLDSDDEPKELDWDDVDQVDLIGLEIGYGLIPIGKPRKWWSTYGACKGY
ncbi:MAG: hypothetical protein CM15mP58_21630 [Burkholderiaceae bacterium]|nr:MAG: hypothetical protein CM15mP58_21630 [Burkholderiaceae bacterium]